MGAWALLGLIACGAPAQPPPAPELGDGFSVAASRGKVTLVTFGYTSCPDVCPTALARLRALQARLGTRAERLEVAFVTVDPERDGAQRLADYVHAFSPRFHPVRLEGAALGRVLARYAVRVERRPLGEGLPQGGAPAYAVDHTAGTFVIDPQGRLREHLPPEATAQQLQARVEALLEEGLPRVEGARVRVSPSGVAAVYLTVHNPGPQEDRLVSARAAGAARVELHEVVAEGTFLRMRARPEGFALPARGALQLSTGGKHLMVYGLAPTATPLQLELRFARAGTLQVSASVSSALDDAP